MSHLLIIHVAALLCVWYLTTYFIADKEENYALVRRIVVKKKRNTEKSLSGTGDNFGKLSGFYVEGVGYSWKTFNLCMLHANDEPNHILRFTNFIPSCCNLHVAAFQLHPTNQKNNLVRTQLNRSGGGVMSQCSSGVFAPDHNPPQC